MEKLQIVLTVLSLIISLGTVCTLVYGFTKFLAKPRESLEERVAVLESKQKDLERDKEKLNIRCKEQDDTNSVLIHSVMALIEFEIQYCLTENKTLSKDLEKAREDLHSYLAKK